MQSVFWLSPSWIGSIPAAGKVLSLFYSHSPSKDDGEEASSVVASYNILRCCLELTINCNSDMSAIELIRIPHTTEICRTRSNEQYDSLPLYLKNREFCQILRIKGKEKVNFCNTRYNNKIAEYNCFLSISLIQISKFDTAREIV